MIIHLNERERVWDEQQVKAEEDGVAIAYMHSSVAKSSSWNLGEITGSGSGTKKSAGKRTKISFL